ncbi:hypothetical protein [Pedomonas mirosovicensis]|uniref:hypothetical protein n=1 Tax=Pedomonas mirosovicensis TaxID=2908641 RepID=UPI002167194C|nr:hypothetical protein [Pedomonas mirosovicensis]MCH8685291.1 hypothetical protein [Pedomonas mirosovicensis]
MSSFWNFAISAAVLVSFILIVFGVRLTVRQHGKERLRGILMVVAGLVLLGNVYLYTTTPKAPEKMPESEARPAATR